MYGGAVKGFTLNGGRPHANSLNLAARMEIEMEIVVAMLAMFARSPPARLPAYSPGTVRARDRAPTRPPTVLVTRAVLLPTRQRQDELCSSFAFGY